MNEYDDILNRIVEEFYDTGRLVLKEDIESDVENEDFGVGSEDKIKRDYISVFDNFFKKKLTGKEISELTKIPRKTISNWVGGLMGKFDVFISEHYNLTKEKLDIIRLFRNKLFAEGEMLRHIIWNEEKKMYDYPEIPTISEIESMVDNVFKNTIPRDTAWSQLYNKSVYFNREKYKMSTDAVVTRINTILKLQHEYGDKTIKEYWDLINRLMSYSEQLTDEEKENRKKEKEGKKTNYQIYQDYWQNDTIYFQKSDDREIGTILNDYADGDIINTSIMNVINKSLKNPDESFCDNKTKTINIDELKNQVELLLDKVDISRFTQKHDVKCIKQINYENKALINVGDHLDIKKNSVKDSFLTELISPFKKSSFYDLVVSGTDSKRNDCNFYKQIYDKIIDTLIVEMNKKGYLEEIKKQITDGEQGLKGLIIDENWFVPLDSLELYWSNKGRGNDHRLTLRYNINGPKYKLMLDPVICKGENCTEQKVTVNKIETVKPVEKKQHKSEIFKLSESKTTYRLDKIIENFFDSGKFVI